MSTRNWISRRSVGSAAIALAASLVFTTSVLAGAYGPAVVLRSGNAELGDMDAAKNIAVVWQEYNHNSVVRSYIRWSSDKGETFAPVMPLRSGAQADSPRVATCADFIFAASTWRTHTGAYAGVDHWRVSDGEPLMGGRFRMGAGFLPDVACRDDVVALAWIDDAEHIRIGIRWLDETCIDPCVSRFEADLGTALDAERPSIAATDHGFVAAWMDGNALRVRRVVAGVDLGSLSASLRPSLTVLENQTAWSPILAARGERVVLTYAANNDTRIRISDDRGRSFASPITVVDVPADANEEGSVPRSVDVRRGWILVELVYAAGLPGLPDGLGYLTDDDGGTWSDTPSHFGGPQMGAFVAGGVAQAWDNVALSGWDDDVKPKLRFHTGPLPDG